MVAFLMGLEGGLTKFPCYVGYWDSRDTTAHYHRGIWPKRTKFSAGKSKVKWDPLIYPSKILMPSLHLKLGLIKQFVKSMDKNSDAFQYLQNFSMISEAKTNAAGFIGPQIKKCLSASNFLKN